MRRAVPSALAHLAGFPIDRMPLPPLLERMWELRAYVGQYDAAYVAPAERLSEPLITCDAAPAKVARGRCSFDSMC